MHHFLHACLLSFLAESGATNASHLADRPAHTGNPRSEFKHPSFFFAKPYGLGGTARMHKLALIWFAMSLTFVAGCGPSEVQRIFEQTRKQFKATDIKAAALPLFSHTNIESLSVTNLPKEITSLPIFYNPGAPPQIWCERVTSNTLMFHTGGGFGHWGLIISRAQLEAEVTKSLHAKVIPWSEGVFFWEEL